MASRAFRAAGRATGGAEWLKGWRSVFFVDWLPSCTWSTEQIKLYVLLCWVGQALWFVVGLFVPEARFYKP